MTPFLPVKCGVQVIWEAIDTEMAKKKINKKVILFVEGSPDTSNGDLRRGFNKLIEPELSGRMPRIIMGGNRIETIRKFLNSQFDAKNVLLIDLDTEESKMPQAITDDGLSKHKPESCYMIQEMEAWFISQKQILADYYKDQKILTKISSRLPKEIRNPKEEVKRVLRGTKKDTYREVAHGTDLLTMLKLQQLKQDFPQVAKLITALKNP